jgi:ParB family chromosome partitioning protein
MGEYAANADSSSAPSSALAIETVEPNPAQPRRTFDQAELDELAASIKMHGIIQPILVRPDKREVNRYQIVAGERRWRAAKLAGLAVIPAVVRELDDLEVLEFAIIENVQRADLNAMEEAEAYDALMRRFGRTQQAVADSLGKSRAHVANTLRLLALPETVRQWVKEGKLTAGHARAALASQDPEALARAVIEGNLTVREAERLATHGPVIAPVEVKSADGVISRKGGGLHPSHDVDARALEADLQRILGLNVELRMKSTESGQLRIDFANLEQLDDVCRRLNPLHQ